jgi:hypothetical protein
MIRDRNDKPNKVNNLLECDRSWRMYAGDCRLPTTFGKHR